MPMKRIGTHVFMKNTEPTVQVNFTPKTLQITSIVLSPIYRQDIEPNS